MAKYPSWPTTDQGNIVAGRVKVEVRNRFGGSMTVLSATDQKDASLAELLAGTAEVFNVKSFSVTGDGVTDDRAAIATADAAIATGAALLFPLGNYRVASNLTIASPCVLLRGAVILPDSGVTVLFDADVDVESGISIIGGDGTVTTHRNTALGVDALLSMGNLGEANTAIGFKPLRALLTGNYNIAIGELTQTLRVTGDYNTVVGYNAMSAAVASGSYNTAVGMDTMKKMTSGGWNVAVGAGALLENTTADHNVAIGTEALTLNTTGIDNVGVGTYAVGTNTTGDANIGVGFHALENMTAGDANVGVGFDALHGNLTGDNNIGIGYRSLYSNTAGDFNVAVGREALRAALGSNNVALGYSAGRYETGSDAFYVDNQDRTDTAGDKAKALLYGTFAADPLDQTLAANVGLFTLLGGQAKFPATARPSADANTLDDYQEGPWTPVDGSGAALSFTAVGGSFVKIGRTVIAMAALTYPATADGTAAKVGGLPFTISSESPARQGFISYSDESTLSRLLLTVSTTTFLLRDSAGAALTNSTMSGNTVIFTALYYV